MDLVFNYMKITYRLASPQNASEVGIIFENLYF